MATDLKFKAGDPVSAKKLNTIIDRLPSNNIGSPVGGIRNSQTVVRVRNDGPSVVIGELVYLDEWLGPQHDQDEAKNGMIFKAIRPVWSSKVGLIGVAYQPIANGDIGLVVVGGLCVVKLSAAPTSDQKYCFVDPLEPWKAKPSYSGFGKIIGQWSPTGIEYGLVIVGDHQNLWRYECTTNSSAPSATTVTLQDRRGNGYGSVDLLDPLSIMSDQTSGDTGWCLQCGNEFEAIQAPCT
jgi:hypothetical protein